MQPLSYARHRFPPEVIRIGGRRIYLWRAVDSEGEVLDILVQPRRDKRAALRLMRNTNPREG